MEKKKEKRYGYESKTHRDWPGKRPDHATAAGRRRKMIKVTVIQTGTVRIKSAQVTGNYLLTSALLNTFETPAPDQQQADIAKKG